MPKSAMEVELKMLPGRELQDALTALRSAGLHQVPDLGAVQMGRGDDSTWVVSVQSDAEVVANDCQAALSDVARVVGIFSSPAGAPFTHG